MNILLKNPYILNDVIEIISNEYPIENMNYYEDRFPYITSALKSGDSVILTVRNICDEKTCEIKSSLLDFLIIKDIVTDSKFIKIFENRFD